MRILSNILHSITLDHTRETPKKQYDELRKLTQQGGRLSPQDQAPHLDRVTFFRVDELDASHPSDSHELTQHRVYDDAVRHLSVLVAGNPNFEVAEMTVPAHNWKAASYKKRRDTSRGYFMEDIATLQKPIKDESGREPEIPRSMTKCRHLDNVTDRPFALITANEFSVEPLLSDLSKKHGKITVLHLASCKADGTLNDHHEIVHAHAQAFDFRLPPSYEAIA